MITDGDTVLGTPEAIELHILDYFRNIFGNQNGCTPNTMIADVIRTLVTSEDNNLLINLLLASEIKTVLFALITDGALGPHGFGGHFYHYFWDFVANDVVMSVQEFFRTGILLPNLNSNTIVLILKVQGANSMSDFRPIASILSPKFRHNFQFKIITKIQDYPKNSGRQAGFNKFSDYFP